MLKWFAISHLVPLHHSQKCLCSYFFLDRNIASGGRRLPRLKEAQEPHETQQAVFPSKNIKTVSRCWEEGILKQSCLKFCRELKDAVGLSPHLHWGELFSGAAICDLQMVLSVHKEDPWFIREWNWTSVCHLCPV